AGRWTYSKRRHSKSAPVTVGIPELLSADRFEALQAALSATSTGPRTRKQAYPLSGRLLGVCGAPFHGVYRRDRGLRQYRCRNSRPEAAHRCADRRIGADDVEAVVWDAVIDLLAEPERLLQMAGDYLDM